jgi:hypothetical protein
MDDVRSMLMQMLSGRMSGDASSRLQETLLARIKQRPAGDPLRDILSAMLDQREPAAQKPLSDPQTLLRAARDALNAMRQRNAAIAAALGGCAECWGAEPDCPRCGGLGRPGWIAPDPAAFAIWVSPALRAMAHSAASTPGGEGTNGSPESAKNFHEGAMP